MYVAGMDGGRPSADDNEFTSPKEIKKCPIDNTFKIVGKKFTVLILRDMFYKKEKHFNEFLRTVEEINPNTLTTRLREMERDGIIERKIYHGSPIRIEYHLTKKGNDLIPIIEQMAAFSMKHEPAIFVDGKTKTFQQIWSRRPASL